MRNLSHKIITITTLFHIIFIGLTLSGCSSTDKRDFEPPKYPPNDPKFIYERTIRSASDIRETSAAMKFQFLATGTMESAIGLGKPFGVAVHKGRIFITDTVQRAIVVFDIPRGEAYYIGNTTDEARLIKPLGIDIDRNTGHIYTVDISTTSIVVYDYDGNFVYRHDVGEFMDRPTGIAISPDGSKLYVIDSGGVSSKRHNMHIFDTKSFELIKTVGKRGKEPGNFNLPLQVSTAPDGTVHVIDGGNFRVQSFTPDGEFIRTFGQAGRRGGNFSRPKSIATDADGNIYVADSAFGNFQIFNSEGQLLLFIGGRGSSGGPGMFMLPAGIEVDEDGRVYYLDQFFRKMDIFRPASLTEEDGYLGTKYKEQIQAEMTKSQ